MSEISAIFQKFETLILLPEIQLSWKETNFFYTFFFFTAKSRETARQNQEISRLHTPMFLVF